MDVRAHWQQVYRTKAASEVSWYQREARTSLRLIRSVGADLATPIIDVGGGASILVDGLLADGYTNVSVLDIAPASLELSQKRLGSRANLVSWAAANVLDFSFQSHAYGVWHDRAAFHFLVAADRARYVDQVKRAVRPGGYLIVATFGLNAPSKCSGLDVVRYSSETMTVEFGSGFRLVQQVEEEHFTPAGKVQPFIYCVYQVEERVSAGSRDQ